MAAPIQERRVSEGPQIYQDNGYIKRAICLVISAVYWIFKQIAIYFGWWKEELPPVSIELRAVPMDRHQE